MLARIVFKMSLIVTHINRFGIIHASDSNISSSGQDVTFGQKVFPISYLNAGLTIAGTYSVDGKSMNDWMPEFIQSQKEANVTTLESFSEILKTKLQSSLRNYEFELGCMIQISGYSKTNGIMHPELWFIRNIHAINNDTGQYENINETLEISEDFAKRDLLVHTNLESFNCKDHNYDYTYFNGFTPGRIGYNILTHDLNNFFNKIWQNNNWKFRPPSNLTDYKLLLNSQMVIIDTLFQLSDDYGRVIGGTAQFHLISVPN
jgi:hypothetical protein